MATPKQTTKFLRQLGTGTIFHWTEQLAKRKDMVPYSDREAIIRIQGLKERIARLKASQSAERLDSDNVSDQAVKAASLNSVALARLEGEVATLEDKERIRREAAAKREAAIAAGQAPPDEPKENLSLDEQAEAAWKARFDADPEIQKIKNMRSKKEVAEYLLENYAVETPEDAKLDELKAMAFEAREKRMDELEAANA